MTQPPAVTVDTAERRDGARLDKPHGAPLSRAVAPPARLAIIMPAFNEAGSITRAVGEIMARIPDAHVIVISDGSSDATHRLAREAGAIAIELPYNLGIGGAVQTGYKYAVAHGYRLVARLDGDGQHDPAQLARLTEPVMAGQADIVIGSRFVDHQATTGDHAYHASASRSIGIYLFARIVSLIVRQHLTDTTSGYQVCNADAAAFFARRVACDYPEIEMVTAACRAGYRVREVPVTMRKRAAGRSSITIARSVYYVFKVLLVLLVSVMRRPDEHVRAAPARLDGIDGLEVPAASPYADQGVA